MRWRILLMALGIVGAAQVCLAAEFPYVVRVNSADVYVRSGPGRDYYPTDKLEKGERLEVYRHDPGGWYAVRPPRGSFTWVSKRHLDVDSEELATVNSNRIVARVGSAFSDARDVIQVRLDKGEKVELVEPPSNESPWCKIAPPAGEFRWVFSKFVDRDVASDGAGDVARGGRADDNVRLTSGADENVSPGGDRLARRDDRREAQSPAPSQVDRELDYLDMELSLVVSQDITTWNFAELETRAQELLRQSQTAVERGRARTLMAKFARFDDIKQRHNAIRTPPVADRRGATATAPALSPAELARYDGVGRLAPVISEKVGGPQFALVDSSNAVVSFVTPAPGVNLRPFVDHYVGVNGQRGYMTDLQRQHINVQHVTVLDMQRR
jgi:SH3-like domain-containing protein